MNQEMPAPVARLTMITLGVSNMRASIAFYEALGFTRKFRATGETVAFFETGGTAIGLFPWDQLAQDVTLPEHPRPQAFRGVTLAWNCHTMKEVDAVLNFAVAKGASLLKPAIRLITAATPGIFPIPTVSLGSRGRNRHRGG
jgi:catechol 2,3-dioxygenase-like lactoylglutathione lyase family enzyme